MLRSKIFDLKNFRGMHLWMDADRRPINIFDDSFFQSALDFQGGDDRTALREIAGQKMQNARPSSKMRTLRLA